MADRLPSFEWQFHLPAKAIGLDAAQRGQSLNRSRRKKNDVRGRLELLRGGLGGEPLEHVVGPPEQIGAVLGAHADEVRARLDAVLGPGAARAFLTGRAALERLRLGNYDLLIADLKMPGMDGLTLIREAKRLKTDLPVIIITGFSTESSAIEAVNLGVAGYLTKPFRVPQVLAAAARALGE